MSRLGKLPIEVTASVQIELVDNSIIVKNGNKSLKAALTNDVDVSMNDNQIIVKPANETKRARSMWGTTRSNIINLVTGVTEGFTRVLEVNGVGYRTAVQNNILTLFLGYSHEIKYVIPEGVDVKSEKNLLTISGADKQKVGQVAAEIRALRKPEPYKGKGVRYQDEYVRMKEGKKK